MADDIDALAQQVVNEIKIKVNAVLKRVAKNIQNDLAAAAAAEVYGAYTPDYYERRYTLSKPTSYTVEVGDLEVSITPTATFNRAYGGWNYGDELGGFMNFGRGWYGYVMGGGAYKVPLPRPYLEHVAQNWNYLIQDEVRKELGEWADVVTAKVTLGDE